ncbi:hypothetical protein D8B26_004402 [Coccidioides posadasii str. Silveira]|nr:hypothetical protein D8B26_004402 [Coccidioides posadasii str. Silveira]
MGADNMLLDYDDELDSLLALSYRLFFSASTPLNSPEDDSALLVVGYAEVLIQSAIHDASRNFLSPAPGKSRDFRINRSRRRTAHQPERKDQWTS